MPPTTIARSTRPLLLLLSLAAGCGRDSRPPSVLLAVLDTTRADAVSAYGQIAGTTPTIDRLAAEGIRYAAAYSQANWTLPSHATLFTGLLPSQHGVICGDDSLADDVRTLAEQLRDRGYETVGLTENPWLAPQFGMARGFERFRMYVVRKDGRPDVEDGVAEWLASRSDRRPFLLFLNVMDAHGYPTTGDDRFMPAGSTSEDVRRALAEVWPFLCLSDSTDPGVAVLRGLYHRGVVAADAKLGRVVTRLQAAGLTDRMITIVTSDHGEFLGEQRLLAHDRGLGEAVLHVPLVVHGLRDVTPAVIEAPVALADVLPSVLSWTGVPLPPGARSLPTRPVPVGTERTVMAEFLGASCVVPEITRQARALRLSHCTDEDRVKPDGFAAIRGPYELLRFPEHRIALFDLRSDKREAHDVAAEQPAIAAALNTMIELSRAQPARKAPRARVDSATAERLRALGYINAPRPAGDR